MVSKAVEMLRACGAAYGDVSLDRMFIVEIRVWLLGMRFLGG